MVKNSKLYYDDNSDEEVKMGDYIQLRNGDFSLLCKVTVDDRCMLPNGQKYPVLLAVGNNAGQILQLNAAADFKIYPIITCQ